MLINLYFPNRWKKFHVPASCIYIFLLHWNIITENVLDDDNALIFLQCVLLNVSTINFIDIFNDCYNQKDESKLRIEVLDSR